MLNSVNKIYFIKFIDINSLLCSYQSFIKRWLSLDALETTLECIERKQPYYTTLVPITLKFF